MYSSLLKLQGAKQWIFFNIDDELVRFLLVSKTHKSAMRAECAGAKHAFVQVYEPFAADFGPLNMGSTFRFCQQALSLLAVGSSDIFSKRAAMYH